MKRILLCLHSLGIKECLKIDMDPPKIFCVSCKRLCCERIMKPVDEYLDQTNLVEQLLDVHIPYNKITGKDESNLI